MQCYKRYVGLVNLYMRHFSRISILFLLLLGNGSWAIAANEKCSGLRGKVARAIVTTAVENREPIDRVLILENNFSKIFFFSDLRHMQGETITHRWEYEGKVVMRKTFDVKGPRWRVFSLKEMEPDMLGHWTVVITDKNDCPLKAVIFQYVKKGSEGPAIINLKK